MLVDKFIFQRHLEKGETVLYAVHKHWVESVGPLIAIFFFGFLLPGLLFYIGFRGPVFYALVGVWVLLAFIKIFYCLFIIRGSLSPQEYRIFSICYV